MAAIVVPSVLATQAAGQARFDVEAETLGEALRALPIADLLFDARGEWSRFLNVYVDGEDARERGGLECPLAGVAEVRIVGMISGG
jgi:molybdopterin converting factor small subunit